MCLFLVYRFAMSVIVLLMPGIVAARELRKHLLLGLK